VEHDTAYISESDSKVVIWWPTVWYSQYETSTQRDANTAHCVCRRGPSSISVPKRQRGLSEATYGSNLYEA